ncbi:MAG: nucleoside phosphorylase [Candidatus Bathyarchaeota archaeon]|nr:nucleoside phosphorylase [Candidatus Bathyarchaeota archaeon A05DMB-3]MDH7606573.1 nucleoside phosphorylase [Candidatus Bathyarchaeota archaeon]
MGEDEPVFTPTDFVRYVAKLRNIPVEAIKVPERLVFTYQTRTYEHAKNLINGKPVDWWIYGERQPLYIGLFNNVDVGLGCFWIGAPAVAMTLEEAIACGARKIVEVGVSGGLQSFLKPGDTIVVTEAIRDEGTSYHYFPPEVWVESSERLRKIFIEQLQRFGIGHHVGAVWSTDGVYRETLGKFRRFRDAGVLAVNMETSAVFAVAKYRKVEAASVQVISDILSESGWLQAFGQQVVRESAKKSVEIALEAISRS